MDSGEGGCPGAGVPKAVEEDLALSPGTVITRLLHMVELTAGGNQ